MLHPVEPEYVGGDERTYRPAPTRRRMPASSGRVAVPGHRDHVAVLRRRVVEQAGGNGVGE